MTITLTNLRHTNPEHTNIELTVSLDTGGPFPFDGTPIPFHYVPFDDAPFTLAIKDELAKGGYTIDPYVKDAKPEAPTDALPFFAKAKI
jgi:hypothetical protein